MSNYGLGAEFERRVAKGLQRDGYFVCRSAGSHGKADLVAIKTGQILLIQCKRSGEIDREEWNEVVDLALQLQPGPISADRTVLPLLALMPGRRGTEFRLLLRHVEPNERRANACRVWTPDL